MLNQQEKEILFSYPVMKEINIFNYISDFIIQNPQNFPITSTIMSMSRNTHDSTKPISDHYTKENITETYEYFINHIGHSQFDRLCKNITATLIKIDKFSRDNTSIFAKFVILEKKENDAVLAIMNAECDYVIIFDTDYENDILVVTKNNFNAMSLRFQFQSVTQMLQNDDFPVNVYKLPLQSLIKENVTNEMDDKEKYFLRHLIFDHYVSGENDYEKEQQVELHKIPMVERSCNIIVYLNRMNRHYNYGYDLSYYNIKPKSTNQNIEFKEKLDESNAMFSKPASTFFR